MQWHLTKKTEAPHPDVVRAGCIVAGRYAFSAVRQLIRMERRILK
jgi:hypothetical protein